MTYEIPVTQARAEFADLINRVVYGGERVVVTRHGKPIVALVAPAELERLDGSAESVVGTVPAGEPGGPPSGERRRFGIAAHHDGPDAGGGRPGRQGPG